MLPRRDRGDGEGGRASRRRRRRTPLDDLAAQVLGRPVLLAVPLHRHRPGLLLLAGLAEIATFGAMVATGSVLAAGALAASVGGYLALVGTDDRSVLVHAEAGSALLAADRGGRPTTVLGPAAPLQVGEPGWAGTPVAVAGRRWWGDRRAAARIAQTTSTASA